MTVYQAADMDKWFQKFEAIADATIQQATNDMLSDIDIVPGINRGGSRKRGTIPRDLGALAASLQSTLTGSTSISGAGENSYVLVVSQMTIGVRAEFVWGGNAAPYARVVHYGSGTVQGTYWVEVAANGWQGYMRAALIKAKAMIR